MASRGPRSKYWRNKCDGLWAKIIKRDGVCEVCGSASRVNSHHLIGRSRVRFRHDIHNGVALCTKHHTGFGNPDLAAHGDNRQTANFLEWLKQNKRWQYDWLMDNKDNKRIEIIDYQQTYDNLCDMDTEGLVK